MDFNVGNQANHKNDLTSPAYLTLCIIHDYGSKIYNTVTTGY